MRERKNILAKWLALEVGKPLVEGVAEVGGAADIFEWNSEETKEFLDRQWKADLKTSSSYLSANWCSSSFSPLEFSNNFSF